MRDNVIKRKTFDFSVRIVRLSQYLVGKKKEYVLSKQIIRSGTSVGAMVRESEFAESRADFIHKMAIGQKEINETIYWLELLVSTDYITNEIFKSLNSDAVEILKIITSIIKKAKGNLGK